MSKHKKKKINLRNLAKVATAQRKNEYLRKIRKVLDVIECGHLLKLIDMRELEIIYQFRCKAIQIVVAENDFMPGRKLKWIRRLVAAMLKRYEVKLMADKGSVDLDTFFTAGATLIVYYRMLDAEDYKNAALVKKTLEPFYEYRLHIKEAYEHLIQITKTASLMLSDMTKRMFWASIDLNLANKDMGIGYHVIWHSVVPERIHVTIKGENHLAYRLGLPEFKIGPKWVSVDAKANNLPVEGDAHEMDVYIQEHALRRLFERNDCISRETIMLELIRAFENPVMNYHADTGMVFIDFNLYKIKTGYLLASISNKRLIIRTFLFITYIETPEGDLLRKNTGLKKSDIEFLELDKLSTFMTAEIYENKQIKHIFVEAGCRSLYKLYNILKEKNITISKHPNTSLIEDYLGIDLAKEYLEEEDEEEETETETETEEVDEEEDIAADAGDEGKPDDEEEEDTSTLGIWKKSNVSTKIMLLLFGVPIIIIAVCIGLGKLIARSIKRMRNG